MTPAPSERPLIDPHERREAVVRLIGSARRRVALAVVRCNDPFVLDALGAALDRGVRVQALLPARSLGWGRYPDGLAGLLAQMGVEVHRYDPRLHYHAKYLVVDDQAAFVGTFNFVRRSFERTSDFGVLTEDADVVGAIGELFETDVRHAPLDGWCPRRVIVGPDHARERLTELLASARERICLVDHKLSDPAMRALLRSRESDGIKIDVLGRVDVRPFRAHGRLLVIDNRLALVGSGALSTRSLDERREVAVLSENPATVRRLAEFVDRIIAGQSAPKTTRGAVEEA